MLAAVYHGPEDLRVEDVPKPAIGPDEALVKVSNANICGTDLRIYKGGHRHYPPGAVRIPGHEVVGEIAAIGEQVAGYEIGQRVFVAPNMGNGRNRATISGNNNMDPDFQAIGINLDGAFAEFMRVPAPAIRQGNLMPISEAVDPAVAALIEPLACVLRGQNAVNVHDGDVVVVMGAGPIGILHVKLANLRGALRVIVSEPAAGRRLQALALGADRVVDPVNEDLRAVVLAESNGRGADVIIVAAPSKVAQETALDITAVGGRINLFGGLPKDDPFVRFDANTVHYKELIVTGTTACSTYDCLRAADIVNSGRLDLAPLITARFPLAEAVAAFAAAADGQNLRVSLEP
ncbi:MAG: alcohol dehydrogenase catalytic domain-containing protein [Chloroflexi bacterium]|nr:alcohol dehydrogenase catalytic domain-containing protein [Chloroflexota bacterium]